jgi:hypothetical protein
MISSLPTARRSAAIRQVVTPQRISLARLLYDELASAVENQVTTAW